jgi:uridine kinase
MQKTQPAVVVVAIAGPSGGGKTTLVQQVATLLDHATQVYFDDYEAVLTYPADMVEWLANGADPNDWKTPQFASDVQALRMGNKALHPNGTTTLQPTGYIVVEEPFGRERQEMAPLIDFVVVIDVPLEIALARRIRRGFGKELEEWSAEQILKHLKHIDNYLQSYIELGSALYGTVNARALTSCDLTVDGRAPAEQLAEQVATAVRSRYSRK